jgi:hypothetical protein
VSAKQRFVVQNKVVLPNKDEIMTRLERKSRRSDDLRKFATALRMVIGD